MIESTKISKINGGKFSVFIRVDVSKPTMVYIRTVTNDIEFYSNDHWCNDENKTKYNLKFDISVKNIIYSDIIVEVDLYNGNNHVHNFTTVIKTN